MFSFSPPSIIEFSLISCAFSETRKLMYRFYCFEDGNAWSRLERGKKLQHFLLDRVAKLTSFVSWTGPGFFKSAEPHTQIPVQYPSPTLGYFSIAHTRKNWTPFFFKPAGP